ncbi:MAG: hypothetical protein LUQ38_03235 [Methanotrichaceae archaeon]|nr:hypothetical protein [Methanotrichaceae archaeon]
MAKLMRMILTAVGVALLNKMLKGSLRSPTNSMQSGNKDHKSKNQIIEINDYKIVDETENQVAKGHKVMIR